MTVREKEELRIVVVEDNADDIEILRRCFAKSGAPTRLRIAQDGEEARRLLEVFSGETAVALPDLILLDLGLPRTRGIDLLRLIRRPGQLRTVPVVVSTGNGDERLLRQCMELGTNLYILKPIALADVMNVIVGVKRYWNRSCSLARTRGTK